MKNCICKIYLKDDKIGIGFLCKIPFNNNILPVLITNNHILNNIDNNKYIILNFNNEGKEKEIKIDKSRKIFHDKNKDITIIEIKPNRDKIYNYLELDENEKNIELENKKREIYIIYYQNKEANVSYSLINKNKNYYCKIEEGSSYSPILSLKTFKVIGIYYSNYQIIKLYYGILFKNLIDEFNKNKNGINIIYKTDKEGVENIFGFIFVEKNKNNIKLIINGNKSNLIEKYKLRKGENNIKIIINNKITNLESMFYNCKSLINIKELEYLDTKDVNDFGYMFYKCSSLIDIKGLENWNVSNGKYFSNMFSECSSLLDIKPLKKWKITQEQYKNLK